MVQENFAKIQKSPSPEKNKSDKAMEDDTGNFEMKHPHSLRTVKVGRRD